MSMRLLHVISSLEAGGAQTQLRLLARGLDMQRFEVHVCSMSGCHDMSVTLPLRDAGVRIHYLQASRGLHAALWWKLARYIGRLWPDAVQTWDPLTSIWGRTATIAARVPATIIATERTRCEDRRLRAVMWQRVLAGRTDAVVVNHRIMQDRLTSWGLPPNKIRLIPDGVALAPAARWPAALTSGIRLTDELGIPRRSKLMAIMGPLVRGKRIKDAIWAVDLLSCVRDDVHLVVLGDGPQRSELESYAWHVEVRDRVHFLGSRDDVPQLIRQFHVYWYTSEEESVSSGLLEAMASGVPVVVTDLATTRSLVVQDKTGLVIPVGDRGELARATLRILDDPPLAKRLSDAARAHVVRTFAAESTVQKYMELYAEHRGPPNGAGTYPRIMESRCL